MASTGNMHFYQQLPLRNIPLGRLVADASYFESAPSDWYAIITDIVNSTGAVAGGRHQEVNLVATGSIVAVLNIAYNLGIAVPFFFGGDGATFLVPTEIKDRLMDALAAYSGTTLQNFGMQLRAGAVAVEDIYAVRLYILQYPQRQALPAVPGGNV